jgi:phospholipid/cholesterol/gamma-HCH transport system substrate-binding protein
LKKKRSEIKTGILITLTIGAVIWGFNLLKGRNLFNRDRDVYAIYSNVDGLVTNSPVLIHGFRAGQVRDVYLHPDNSGRVIVRFSITENSFFVPDNTVARIVNDGLLGSKALTLLLGSSKTNVVDGDTLPGETSPSMGEQFNDAIGPIKDRANKLLQTIDSVLIIVQDILNKDARTSLTSSFESVKKALATLSSTANKLDNLVESEGGKISSILSNLSKITNTIASNNDKLTIILKNFASISDSLARSNIKSTIDNANLTLQKTALIMDKINSGEGSMGLLINDKKLYHDLDSTTANLNRLFDDMRLHPKRYVHLSVFGKGDKKATKPEIEDLKNKIGNVQKENDELRKQIELLQKK